MPAKVSCGHAQPHVRRQAARGHVQRPASRPRRRPSPASSVMPSTVCVLPTMRGLPEPLAKGGAGVSRLGSAVVFTSVIRPGILGRLQARIIEIAIQGVGDGREQQQRQQNPQPATSSILVCKSHEGRFLGQPGFNRRPDVGVIRNAAARDGIQGGFRTRDSFIRRSSHPCSAQATARSVQQPLDGPDGCTGC